MLIYIPPSLHSVTLHFTKAHCYYIFHQDCTLLIYIPPTLHRVTLYSSKTAHCYFTFKQGCSLLFYITPRPHRVTLRFTKTPCYFTFHQECSFLFYIPPRLHRVTLQFTKTPCYFIFHQVCTLLFYIKPRLHRVTLHSNKTASCILHSTRVNVFSSSVTKAHFVIPKSVAPESACLIAPVHHIVTTRVGKFIKVTDGTCVMFTPISITSQMIQTLKCGRQTGTQRCDKQTYFSFTEEK